MELKHADFIVYIIMHKIGPLIIVTEQYRLTFFFVHHLQFV
jgi:hypothetical protein